MTTDATTGVHESEIAQPGEPGFGLPEFLPEFLDRGGDMLAEFGYDETVSLAKVIAVPFMAALTADRQAWHEWMSGRVDAFADRFSDLPEDATPLSEKGHRTLRLALWVAEASINDENASRFVAALPDVIRLDCVEAAGELMQNSPGGAMAIAPARETPPLNVRDIKRRGGDDPEAWALLVVLEHAGNEHDELGDAARKVERAFPGIIEHARNLATGMSVEMTEEFRRLFMSNTWSPDLALVRLASVGA